MVIAKMQPVQIVDWEKVEFVRVTLEKPYKGGGLRWRHGTTDAKRNLNYNAHDPSSGPVFWPGANIMYPEDQPALAGNPDRDTFLMPLQAAMDCFGHFYAPLEVQKNGLIGLTLSEERTRVAAKWSWYKMPPGDGTMHPPMSRVGPPDIPDVALRPLSKTRMQPLKHDGEEIVIRPRDFFDFDNPAMYEKIAGKSGDADVAAMLSGFTSDEIDVLRELVKAKVANGKPKV